MITDDYTAVGVGTNLRISDKHVCEIINFIKGMDVDKAIKKLERVTEFKEPVPLKRFNDSRGHKPGMAAGSYPQKACKQIILLLKNAKNNAINKGLQEGKLFVKKGVTCLGISRSNRVRSRKGGYTGSVKSTHVYITLEEREAEQKKKVKEKKALKEVKKEEVKKK